MNELVAVARNNAKDIYKEGYRKRIDEKVIKEFAIKVLSAYSKNYFEFQDNILNILKEYGIGEEE